MTYAMIFFPFYFILLLLDLYHAKKRKEFRYFWLQIPIYAIVFVLNVLFAAGAHIPSISTLLAGIFPN